MCISVSWRERRRNKIAIKVIAALATILFLNAKTTAKQNGNSAFTLVVLWRVFLIFRFSPANVQNCYFVFALRCCFGHQQNLFITCDIINWLPPTSQQHRMKPTTIIKLTTTPKSQNIPSHSENKAANIVLWDLTTLKTVTRLPRFILISRQQFFFHLICRELST